jgi:hypothetical protein
MRLSIIQPQPLQSNMLFISSHSRPRYTRLTGSSDALALAVMSTSGVLFSANCAIC